MPTTIGSSAETSSEMYALSAERNLASVSGPRDILYSDMGSPKASDMTLLRRRSMDTV